MKILLVPDILNWAFDRDASAVIRYLPEYNIDKVPKSAFHRKFIDEYDLVHFMSWYDMQSMPDKVSAGVSSHNFELLHYDASKKIFPKYKALVGTSRIIYDKLKDQNDNVFCAQGGVHHDMFIPVSKPESETFVIGWVAQKTSGKIDIKGYTSVLLPLMKQLSIHKNIEFKLLSNTPKNSIKYSDMPSFFDNVDCQICTSLTEGAPNPMFEAASCGKALISTNVGAISEFIQHGENGFIVDAYNIGDNNKIQETIRSFAHYILTLRGDRDRCRVMGIKSREIVEESWTWEKRARNWIPVFELFNGR